MCNCTKPPFQMLLKLWVGHLSPLPTRHMQETLGPPMYLTGLMTHCWTRQYSVFLAAGRNTWFFSLQVCGCRLCQLSYGSGLSFKPFIQQSMLDTNFNTTSWWSTFSAAMRNRKLLCSTVDGSVFWEMLKICREMLSLKLGKGLGLSLLTRCFKCS